MRGEYMTHEPNTRNPSGCSPYRGHLTGGYVAPPSATPKFTYGKLHISPER